jgi:acetolactate synthase-1/2/3 large subunit
MEMKVADVIVKCLEAEGIEYAFGITGSHYLAFFKALKNSSIKFISVKHESAAAFMAGHYAKFAQKPALVMATAGPGAMNLLAGIAELYKSNLPCFILTPIVSTELQGKNVLQEDSGYANSYSISDIMKCITKKTITCIHPENIASYIQDLFRNGLTGIKGPVHLLIPVNFLEKKIPYSPVRINQYRAPDERLIDHDKIKSIADKLSISKKPVLLIGHRAWYPNVSPLIREISNMFGIPTVLSASAKGLFNEFSPYFAGILDIYGHRSAEYFVKKSDLILSIGLEFSEFTTIKYDPDLFGEKLIQIDIDAREIGRNYPVQLSTCGDLGLIIEFLITEMKCRGILPFYDENFHQEYIKENGKLWQDMEDGVVPLRPARIYKEISDLIDSETIIVSDMGANNFNTYRHLGLRENCYSALFGNYTMGQGVSGVIGAKIASPQKMVISISGDGSFLMNGMEIATARQYEIPIIWIIFVDKSYGMVEWSQRILYNDLSYCTDIYVPDLSKMAESFSIEFYKITDIASLHLNLVTAFKNYKENKTSCLIEINFDTEDMLPIKPRVVKFIQDMGNTDESAKSPYLMRAFKSILREKV